MVVVQRRKLGTQGLEVSAIGLGCMGMSPLHGAPKPEKEIIQVIQTAIELGITFLDTSDLYGPHTNTTIISQVSDLVYLFHTSTTLTASLTKVKPGRL